MTIMDTPFCNYLKLASSYAAARANTAKYNRIGSAQEAAAKAKVDLDAATTAESLGKAHREHAQALNDGRAAAKAKTSIQPGNLKLLNDMVNESR